MERVLPVYILTAFAIERGPWKTFDPFLMCVYHNDAYPAAAGETQKNHPLGPPSALLRGRSLGGDFSYKDGWSMYHGETVPGFPEHPHRGFETITVVRQGLVDHFDSLGATSRYGKGDTQWVTTGRGIQHSEMFPLINTTEPNPLDLFQIWVNLPAKNKMVDPYYTMFWGPHTPVYTQKNTETQKVECTVLVIAGQLKDVKPLAPPPDSWASRPESDLAVWIITLAMGAEFELPVATKEDVHRTLYLYKGKEALVGDYKLKHRNGVKVNSTHPALKLSNPACNGEGEVQVLMLQGRPIGEPVAQQGPFVMNTKAEIAQAFSDYRATQFGGWPWEAPDVVHPKEKERFAKYPDGRVETAPCI